MLNKQSKKFSLILFLILNYFFAINLANANQNFRFYGGLDLSIQDIHLTGASNYSPKDYIETSTIAPSIFTGLEFNKKFKIEASYIQTDENKTNNNAGLIYQDANQEYEIKTTKSKIKSQILGLDFKPFFNINENLNAYFIAGLSYNKINIEQDFNGPIVAINIKNTASKIAPVLGFGIEYFVDKNIFLRGQFKYSHLNIKFNKDSFVEKIDNITNLNLGLGYYF